MTPAAWAAAALCTVAVGRAAAAGRRPLSALFGSALCGAAGLAVVALLSPLTGVSLPLNPLTGFAAAVLGLPGVVTLLFLQVLL
mgnify:CR=1 FL=1